METSKAVFIAGAAAVAAGFTYQLIRYKKLEDGLEAAVFPMVHDVNEGGIEISLRATIKNTTSYTVKLTHPVIKLLYEGREMVTSEPKDELYTLEGFNKLELSPILFKLNYLKLISTVPDFIKQIRGERKFKAIAQVSTKMDRLLPIKKLLPLELQF